MMERIRRDDQVVVTTGKERGKQGQVHLVFRSKQRIVIQGVNMVKRHKRQTDQRTPAGIIEQEAPIHISNVKLICSACQKPVRVRFRVRTDGTKARVCRSCNEDID